MEDGYRDLKRLGLEHEITTTSAVGTIKKKLPQGIKRDWTKIVCTSATPINKANKFPPLLKFLLDQKNVIEYEIFDVRVTGQITKRVVHHTTDDQKPDDAGKQYRSKCLLHENGVHWTSICRLYLFKPVEERKRLLKAKGTCWSCLKLGNISRTSWRNKRCGKNNCTEKHHPTLHEDKPAMESETPSEASGTSNACDSYQSQICLLQIQRIKSRTGYFNVMCDSGTSLSFITNIRAKLEKLKGQRIELSITKVGGKTETLQY